MILIAESAAESDLIWRKLPAIKALLPPGQRLRARDHMMNTMPDGAEETALAIVELAATVGCDSVAASLQPPE